MRDPNRIKPFLEELEKCWNMCPDWRFFQIIENFKRLYGISDAFYLEDTEALEMFKKMFESLKSS